MRSFIKNIKNIFTIVLLLAVIVPLQLNAQSNDSIQLIYPIPHDDGNPLNENNASGFFFNEPDNVTREIIYDPATGKYTFYSKIGDFMYKDPYTMDQKQYLDYYNNKSVKDYWKERREAQGKPTDKPNFIISTGYQVVWEKFADLWQIEMRTIPLTLEQITLDPKAVIEQCDENTICVVPIQGVTWTGLNDDVEALDAALDEYNKRTGYDIPIHVDAASGGFILPFLQPEKKWDFRLKWVLSISTSGHKYGLVYPGLGWVIWKDKKYLPGKMSFSVNYLGADITQVGLNFSRPGAQVLGQYYQFIRLGFEGYRQVQQNSMEIARYLHTEIGKMSPFKNYSTDIVNPLFIWYMKEEYAKSAKWTLFDLQDKLKQSGWMVPAYTMPKNIEDSVVMRIVVRQGFSRDMADMLLGDIRSAIADFERLDYPTPSRMAQEKNLPVKPSLFTHTGAKRG